MTISIEQASIQRAQAALMVATQKAGDGAKRRAFTKMAYVLLQSENGSGNARLKALSQTDSLIEKAISHGLGNPEWEGGAAALAAAFVASVPEHSLLDAIRQHARILPTAPISRILLASAAVGELASEGDPVPVRNLSLSTADIESTHSAAMVVVSQELILQGGDAAGRLFELELSAAVGRASNGAVLSQLIDSSTPTVQGTGDPLADLRIGLDAAGASSGYVVAAPAGAVADLATRVEAAPGFSVRGGTFRPGISVVAIDGAADLTIIPASRLAVWDGGLRVRGAEHASIDMRDTPQSPAEQINLWQAGLYGLLCERRWHLGGDRSGVVIVEGQS